MNLYPLLSITASILLSATSYAEDELVMVNLLYRHGARSPAIIYPTDPNNNKWPDGLGRLTQKGMNLEYNLGKFLRERYVETKFINTSYLHGEVKIRSSGVDRCLQSAETQLAGLYPPEGWQVWNKDLAWQPIPVQTVPTDQDPLLRPESTNCPRYKQIVEEMFQSNEFKQKEKENQELLDYVSKNAGLDINLRTIWTVEDPTSSELYEGMTPPQWVMDRFPEIRDLAFWSFSYKYYGTAELARLTGGTLLGEMIANMKGYVAKKETATKFNIYSAHDSTILSLSSALNIRIPQKIPFGACALVELFHTAKGENYVTLKYGNDTNYEYLIPVQIDNCDYRCPLDQFESLTKMRIPVDREAECRVKKTGKEKRFLSYSHLKVTAIIFILLTVTLCLVVIWMCVRKHFQTNVVDYTSIKNTELI